MTIVTLLNLHYIGPGVRRAQETNYTVGKIILRLPGWMMAFVNIVMDQMSQKASSRIHVMSMSDNKHANEVFILPATPY